MSQELPSTEEWTAQLAAAATELLAAQADLARERRNLKRSRVAAGVCFVAGLIPAGILYHLKRPEMAALLYALVLGAACSNQVFQAQNHTGAVLRAAESKRVFRDCMHSILMSSRDVTVRLDDGKVLNVRSVLEYKPDTGWEEFRERFERHKDIFAARIAAGHFKVEKPKLRLL